jgi:homoserine O-succinyltransferase/O-acetyltransferase
MPIILPRDLPAGRTLADERISVLTRKQLPASGIPALQILLLNLMPTKIVTETQLARVLSNSPLPVELTLLRTATHAAGHVDPNHLRTFYHTFPEIRMRRFDGLIITGAPVETLPWHEVDYWGEISDILAWSADTATPSLFICWGAQAALQYFHGIGKRALPAKRFGVFWHHLVQPSSPLIRDHDDDFLVPVSRHTETPREEVAAHAGLEILAASEVAGLHLVWDQARRRTYLFNHPEYDADTLDREYRRDRDRGLPIALPKNYYPDDDPSRPPRVRWRSHAHLIYTNWLSHQVHDQQTQLAYAPGTAGQRS